MTPLALDSPLLQPTAPTPASIGDLEAFLFSSQLALWRLLTVQGLWHYPRFALSDHKLVKRHLKLLLLWSSKVEVVQLQVWAVLIIAQILHTLQVEIAGRAGVAVFDVSLALLVEYLPHYRFHWPRALPPAALVWRDNGF